MNCNTIIRIKSLDSSPMHVYMLTVPTRDLVDHTCLLVVWHSVFYSHQGLVDRVDLSEDSLDSL